MNNYDILLLFRYEKQLRNRNRNLSHSRSRWQRQCSPTASEKLKVREVVHIDIAKDKVATSDYKPDEDPTKFKSEKTGRGPLVNSNWRNEVCNYYVHFYLCLQGVSWLNVILEMMETNFFFSEIPLFWHYVLD